MLNTYRNINHNHKYKDFYNNNIENSENLYQNTYTPRPKRLVYCQPEPIPLNNNYINRPLKSRNFSIDNNYHYKNDYYGNREHYFKNKIPPLRFNNAHSHKNMHMLNVNE